MQFEKVLEENKNKIFRVCKMFSQNTDERKDLFQEICIQLYKSFDSFRSEATYNTFMYRISINTCIRYKYKYQIGSKHKSIEDDDWFIEDDTMINLDKKERLENLYKCIETLNQADKSIVLLYLEDQSHKEIAEIAGISENLVAVKMSRIRERLFNCLTPNLL